MKTVILDGGTVQHSADNIEAPNVTKSDILVTSVRVIPEHGHDRLVVFNRGQRAGDLIVGEGDGGKIARRLLADASELCEACRAYDALDDLSRADDVRDAREYIVSRALAFTDVFGGDS